MFDIDAGKLLIIGLVALVVIGPKDLPRVLRQVGQMVARLRKMAGEFQGQFMEAMKEADLQDLRAEVAKLKDSATLDVDFNPARDLQNELTKAVDQPASIGAVETARPAAAESVSSGAQSPASEGVLPAPAAEVGADSNLVAAGIAPVAEAVAASPSVAGLHTEMSSVESASGTVEPERRKVLVPRRRPPSRFEAAKGGGPALHRPRNFRPVRRETADQ